MTTEKVFTTGSDFPAYKPGTIRLYSMRFCPYAQRTRIVLAHKDIQYETVNINLQNKPEWYFSKINPLGKVPALQIDDKIVYESLITCQYLDDVHPENKLTPEDPYQRAQDGMLLEIYSNISTNYYKFLRSQGQDTESKEALYSAMDTFDAELKKRGGQFFGGDKPMMIDFMVWPHMELAFSVPSMVPTFSLPADRYPNVRAWEAQMRDVPAAKKCIFPPEQYMLFLKSYRSGTTNYDVGLEE